MISSKAMMYGTAANPAIWKQAMLIRELNSPVILAAAVGLGTTADDAIRI